MTIDSKYKILKSFFTCFALLPLGGLYLFSDMAYFIVYYVIGYRRKTVRHNLELVFGTSDRKRLGRIEKKFYRHLCDCMVETVKLLHISDKEIDRRVDVTNGELIDGIVRSGRSVVLFLGHYGNWEWVQAIIHHFHEPLVGGQIYRPLRNKVMDRLMLKVRSRFGLECIPQKNAVRRLIGIEREGKKFVIGFISDQRPLGSALHYWTDFLYIDVEKTSRGHYRLTFVPVTPDPSDDGQNPYTREFMKMLEKTIYREPAYWLWSHKRWKRHREQN